MTANPVPAPQKNRRPIRPTSRRPTNCRRRGESRRDGAGQGRRRHPDDGAVSWRSRRPIPASCCSIAWAISTSCSSRTRRPASAALDIALTKRGQHQGADIPMCGVPVHAADGYLDRLIRKGFKVAVCEQMEGPGAAKKRGSKSVVRRDVVRLVTPGTITEDALLDARAQLSARWPAPRGGGWHRLARHLDRRLSWRRRLGAQGSGRRAGAPRPRRGDPAGKPAGRATTRRRGPGREAATG